MYTVQLPKLSFANAYINNKPERNLKFMLYAFIAAGIFLLDLGIKDYIERTGEEGKERRIGKGMLLLRKHHNKGAALNAGQDRSGWVTVLSIVLTLAMTMLFLVTFSCKGNRMLKTGLAFLLGGAYSNTYDRVRRHYVVDYVSFPVKNKMIRQIVFNISDFFIMIGAFLMVIGSAEQ